MIISSPKTSISGIQSVIPRSQQISLNTPEFVTMGVWAEISPDGTKLCYSKFSTTDLGADGTGTFQLFICDIDGTNEIALSADILTTHCGMVGFHPTEKWMVVTREMLNGNAVHATKHPGKGIYVNLWAINYTDLENPVWHQLTNYDNEWGVDPGPFGCLQAKFNKAGTKLAWTQKIDFDVADPANFSFWDLAIADWSVTDGVPAISNKVTYTPGSCKFIEVWGWNNDDTKLIIASDAGTIAGYMDSQVWTIGAPSPISLTGPNFNWDEQTFWSPSNARVIIGSSFAQPVAYDPLDLWNTWFTDLWSATPTADGPDFQQLTFFNTVGHDQYYPRSGGRVVRLLPSDWHKNGTLVFQVLFNDGSTQVHEDSELWIMRTNGNHIDDETETTVVINPSSDATLLNVTPTTSYPTLTTLGVGDVSASFSGQYRFLMKFDLSSIPTDAVVVSAKLELYESLAYNSPGQAAWDVDIHRVLSDWDATQATWNNRLTATPWTVAGAAGNVTTTKSAVLVMDGVAAVGFVSFEGKRIRDDVQRWINGSVPNYGYLGFAGAAEGKGVGPIVGNIFASQDDATPSHRPKLTITYRTR